MKKEEQLLDVSIRVSIRDTARNGGYLEISEDIKIPACAFCEMAAILGKFHELAQKIEKETKERE